LAFIAHYGPYTNDVVVFSDDGGSTFTRSPSLLPKMDEAAIVELWNGTLMANMRNDHDNACKCRGVATSDDGGDTWSPIFYDPVLIEPVCQASIVRIGDYLYFSNPASTVTRANITIRRTAPQSTTWVSSLLVAPGEVWGGYSQLLPQPIGGNGGTVGGIIFERTDTTAAPGNQTVISFVQFPLNF